MKAVLYSMTCGCKVIATIHGSGIEDTGKDFYLENAFDRIIVLKMNKTELVVSIAEKAAISKKDAEKALSAFLDTVVDELKKGEKVQLVGFGTFEVRERAARTGINPRTKQTIEISASKNPVFKAGKALKDSISK